MGERKVQAKYYPPDFDPSKLPRIKKKRQNDDAVRFMLPMSVRCETCGEFMGTGLKFNARKSDTYETYLGIRIFRFSMKCKSCPASFIIRTDPKNSDYSCESGVRRNYEPWRAAKGAEEEGKEERKRQDEDAIQALENKTKDAKQEMEDLDALDELKSIKAKRAKVNIDDILAKDKAMEAERVETVEREMLEEAKIAFEKKRHSVGMLPTASSQIVSQRFGAHIEVGSALRADQSKKERKLGVALKIVRRIKRKQAALVPTGDHVQNGGFVSHGADPVRSPSEVNRVPIVDPVPKVPAASKTSVFSGLVEYDESSSDEN